MQVDTANLSLAAGVAVADITPRELPAMSGGAFGVAKGVTHPLAAKALYFAQGDDQVLLIVCDLLGMDGDLDQRVRQRICDATGVPFDAILVTCTHTHGAPATMSLRHWGSPDEEYCLLLAEAIAPAAAEAIAQRSPAALNLGATRCPGVARNRALVDGVVDDVLGVATVAGPEGQMRAVLVNYGCHPVNEHSSRMITPDFPWQLERELQSRLGSDVPVLFVSGAAGDLVPANFDFNPSEELSRETGGKLADAAYGALSGLAPSESSRVSFSCREVDLPLAALPSVDELDRIMRQCEQAIGDREPTPTDWDDCKHRSYLDWAREAKAALNANAKPGSRKVKLHALRVGDLVVVGIPGEPFSEHGRAIREQCPAPATFVATQCNGEFGYFPNRQAYADARYEAVHCPRYMGLYAYEPQVGELVCDAAIDLTRDLERCEHNPQSRRLWGRATQVIVGGGQTHRRPVKYMYRGGPSFAVEAQGPRFRDADGRWYIDYLMSYGPIVLGHGDPQFIEAITKQLALGTILSVEHPLTVELAETLCELIPCAEMVAYFIGGSSATQGALRCARAVTGREVIIRCGYHGWFDWCVPGTPGVPRSEEQLIVAAPYDDSQALADALAKHRGEVAGVIIESYQNNGPSADYFPHVRELCDEHGAVFILDEVKTGFRFDMGGAQRMLGIDPDLATFGKAMGNGFPISVLVGRRDILRQCTNAYMAATFHADPLSLTAAMAVIRIMRERDGIAYLHEMGRRLIEGVNEVLDASAIPLRLQGHPAMPTLAEMRGEDDHDWQPGQAMSSFCAGMQNRGVFVTGHPWFLSLAHGDAEISQTIEAAAAVVADTHGAGRNTQPAGSFS